MRQFKSLLLHMYFKFKLSMNKLWLIVISFSCCLLFWCYYANFVLRDCWPFSHPIQFSFITSFWHPLKTNIALHAPRPTVGPNDKKTPKINMKNSGNGLVILHAWYSLTSFQYEVDAITGNGNEHKSTESCLKISREIKLTCLWQILAIWNLCAAGSHCTDFYQTHAELD